MRHVLVALFAVSALAGCQRKVTPERCGKWIDKFLEFKSGEFARAIKNLTLAEEHLHDHLPGYPVMPAPLTFACADTEPPSWP